MWGFQENIYKTKSVSIPDVPPETFTINSEGSTARIRIRGTGFSIDWGDSNSNSSTFSSSYHDSGTHNYGSSATRTITITPNTGLLSSITHLDLTTGTLDNHISFIEPLINLQSFVSGSTNNISGDLFSIDPMTTLIDIRIAGLNTLSGNITNLPTTFPNVEILSVTGNNTLTGSITSSINLPSLDLIDIFGSNTLSGDISGIHVNLLQIRILGNNTISGNISSLITKINLHTFRILGLNTLTGDIINVPSQIQQFGVTGNNTISGNTSDINLTNMRHFLLEGVNTLTGLIENLPTIKGIINGTSGISIGGNNTISGNLANYQILELDTVSFYSFDIRGNNSINFTLPSICNWYHVSSIVLFPGVGLGLTSTEVDDLLIDIDTNITVGGVTNSIWLHGSNDPRTSSSDVAVASLISKGFDVITN